MLHLSFGCSQLFTKNSLTNLVASNLTCFLAIYWKNCSFDLLLGKILKEAVIILLIKNSSPTIWYGKRFDDLTDPNFEWKHYKNIPCNLFCHFLQNNNNNNKWSCLFWKKWMKRIVITTLKPICPCSLFPKLFNLSQC